MARWLTDDEQAVWRAFIEATWTLSAQLNREMQADSGISDADFAVLVALSEHPDGRMRVLELARGLKWEKSRLSHQLSRMQQRGLVERFTCQQDRRGSYIELAAAGRAAVESAAPAHVEGVRRYVFDGLSDDQVRALGTICNEINRRLAASCGGGCDDDEPADAGPVADAGTACGGVVAAGATAGVAEGVTAGVTAGTSSAPRD